ncbi:MAG: hypothetical protein KJ792_05450 [Actinobacteria bacterium]|nr:hypothetical protein [Actinomycetota bacterium]MCG2802354.1 hypothetical protein [Cellulomonas sp.]
MPRLLTEALDKAVSIPSSTIEAHVATLRRRNPHASPEQIVRMLEQEYLLVVAGTGAAVGAAAALPAVGTGVALALTTSDVATFFGASAAFSLAVASVHGIAVQDTERRRALLLATILGDSGARAVSDAAEISGLHIGRVLLTRMPMTTVRKVNTTLTRRLVRNQAAKQTGLAVGRLMPFGVGAAIGAIGGRALGRSVVDGARTAFGPAPQQFTHQVEVSVRDEVPGLPAPTPSEPRQLGQG